MTNGNNEPKPPEALSVGRYTERLWGYKDQVGSHSEMGRLYERDRADFWHARFKEATSNETPPRSKKRVDVPAGEVWWADGVLTDADFLLKLAKGLAVADPRADRLCRIADAMDRPAHEPLERHPFGNGTRVSLLRAIHTLRMSHVGCLEDAAQLEKLLTWLGKAHRDLSSGAPCCLEDGGECDCQSADITRCLADSKRTSPADLVGALQDVVHTDPGPVRAGKAHRDASPAIGPPLCNCQDGECHGPDVAQAYGHLCRAEDEPKPFCAKHPNTAFADTGCPFCGTPPTSRTGEQ